MTAEAIEHGSGIALLDRHPHEEPQIPGEELALRLRGVESTLRSLLVQSGAHEHPGRISGTLRNGDETLVIRILDLGHKDQGTQLQVDHFSRRAIPEPALHGITMPGDVLSGYVGEFPHPGTRSVTPSLSRRSVSYSAGVEMPSSANAPMTLDALQLVTDRFAVKGEKKNGASPNGVVYQLNGRRR